MRRPASSRHPARIPRPVPIGAFACVRAACAMLGSLPGSTGSEKCGATTSHTAAGSASYGNEPASTGVEARCRFAERTVARATNSSRDAGHLPGATIAARPRDASTVPLETIRAAAQAATRRLRPDRAGSAPSASPGRPRHDVAEQRVPAAELQHVGLARMACKGAPSARSAATSSARGHLCGGTSISLTGCGSA